MNDDAGWCNDAVVDLGVVVEDRNDDTDGYDIAQGDDSNILVVLRKDVVAVVVEDVAHNCTFLWMILLAA